MPERPEAPVEQRFSGPNAAYVLERYWQWRKDPQAVSEPWRQWLAQWAATLEAAEPHAGGVSAPAAEAVVRAMEAITRIRADGHLYAHVDPLAEPSEPLPVPDLAEAGALPAAAAGLADRGDTLAAVVSRLARLYSGSVGYEFEHLAAPEEKAWLYRAVEVEPPFTPLSALERRMLYQRLVQVEEFERFLHTTFPGQKRFSVEGLDALVPMLDELIHLAGRAGAAEVFLGMAHRGRLNVLAHVLGKPYEAILSEFHTAPNPELVPSEGSHGLNSGWMGDVKYHLGRRQTVAAEAATVRVTLANNPSHLEFVNPVVEGMTRAAQDTRTAAGVPQQESGRALAILVHGDAAFTGEGVVAETLNLARLAAYRTGGTVHIIANNGLGFTAGPEEARSTRYASDLAKGFDVPVVHVNADDPEACLACVRLAFAFRQRFGRDFLIDLVGYRRWGHNEGDDPSYTQPVLYTKVAAHPTVRAQYGQQLQSQGVLSRSEQDRFAEAARERLRAAYQAVRQGLEEPVPPWAAGFPAWAAPAPTAEEVRGWHAGLLRVPEGFQLHPRLARVLARWQAALDAGGSIDWGLAEGLAFAGILADGVPIRLTGQDSERGTFSQRHAVWHDARSDRRYVPLQHLPQARAAFLVANSPLSEAAVLGFEYGYNVQAGACLVLWEAQYGDFANAAQVFIDQFVAAGRAKWVQESGLVLLLPHGYEGQGPEHSSAGIERYLQLAAEDNWRVIYPSTAAQYFHALRAQAHSVAQAPRPLVVFTPKSLLRHPQAASSLTELTTGAFQPLRTGPGEPATARRLIVTTAKMAVELSEAAAPEVWRQALLVRLEMLYPFPEAPWAQLVSSLPQLQEVVWVQEEPENRGAWRFAAPYLQRAVPAGRRLRYVGRPARAAPAEGFSAWHVAEQQRLVREALADLS